MLASLPKAAICLMEVEGIGWEGWGERVKDAPERGGVMDADEPGLNQNLRLDDN